MILRLLLVGAVTSLGLDLPSSDEMSRWVGSARTWWEAHEPVAQAECAMPNGDAAFAAPATPRPAPETPAMPNGLAAFAPASPPLAAPALATSSDGDREFQAVVAAMVAQFDVPTPAQPAEPLIATEAATQAEPPAATEDAEDPGVALAYALNREAEGLTLPADLPPLSRSELVTSEAEAVSSDRLADAVRLTGKAFHAWVALLHTPTVVSVQH